MTTLRKWLDKFTETYETPLTIKIGGESSWGSYNLETWYKVPVGYFGDFKDCPSEILDNEFNDGYGAPGCPGIYAWSENWVFAISTYDGSTDWFALPRFPIDVEPIMPGGG